jgi:hypothetical protein
MNVERRLGAEPPSRGNAAVCYKREKGGQLSKYNEVLDTPNSARMQHPHQYSSRKHQSTCVCMQVRERDAVGLVGVKMVRLVQLSTDDGWL